MEQWAKLPYVQQSVLGKSVEGRTIDKLETVTTGQQGYIVLIGRQHPPEVTGALAMTSFIDRVFAADELATRFREKFGIDMKVGMLSNKAIVFVIQRNASEYIEKCLDSIMWQDYEDLGILFIDDASDDNTLGCARQQLTNDWTDEPSCYDVAFYGNEIKKSKIASIKQAIDACCDNEDSVLFWLDGDVTSFC